MTRFTFEARTRVLVGPGRLSELGEQARALGMSRVLMVAEQPLIDVGHAPRAERVLRQAGIAVHVYADFAPNPDSAMAEHARAFAAPLGVDGIVGLGGGSSLDLAKAANFLLSHGGSMSDYAGYNLSLGPMLPLICVPTSTGTGSEAQSYCVMADAETKRKMACGAPGAAARLALLDPELTLTQPIAVRAAAGYDALAHAVETWVSTKRNDLSTAFGREAWRLLSANYEAALARQEDLEALAAMHWGAFLAGWAIEHSMLGAAHACANPLTQRYGTTHALALSVMLPHVVRLNMDLMRERYAELEPDLPSRLEGFSKAGQLPLTLRELNARQDDFALLAERASQQWTGQHNPRPFDAPAALELYRRAW